MSASAPLLDNTIEPDELPDIDVPSNRAPAQPVVLTPTTRTSQQQMASTQSDAENGIAGIIRQSSHPVALIVLYLFRIGAILAYIFSGLFPSNYVLTTVVVVVLLAMDFWNCRNVAGRTLVGLRFWNQVDDDGESYWVFESRDPSRPANPVDSRMFWIALYTFPLLWTALLIVSILKLSISFIPIVILALVFNVTNVVGFTYADRDAKQKWASQAAGGWGLNNLGTQLMAGAVQRSVGRMFS